MKKEIIDLLKNKKEMKRRKLFVIDTVKVLEEAINYKCAIKFFLYSNKGVDVYEDCKNYIKVGADKVKESYIEKYSTVKNHQDFIAVAQAEQSEISDKKGNKDRVLLDTIQDPANMGAIIRSASAFGINDFYMYDCVYPFNEKVIRASAGSSLGIRFNEADKDQIKDLRKDFKFVVTDVDSGKNLDAMERNNDERFMIVMGSEGRGVSGFIKNLADYVIKIDYPNKKIESLNVSAAAAIIFYELRKK